MARERCVRCKIGFVYVDREGDICCFNCGARTVITNRESIIRREWSGALSSGLHGAVVQFVQNGGLHGAIVQGEGNKDEPKT